MFDWVAKIAIGKSVSKGVKAGLALFAGAGLVETLKSFGVTVEIDQNVLAASLGGAVLGIYEFVRNYLKSKGITKVP